MISSTLIMQQARRGTSSARRAVVACQRRNQSACVSVDSAVIDDDEHEREAEARGKFLRHFHGEDEGPFREHMVYSLSFADKGLESDLESDDNVPLIDDRMKRQLRNSFNALLSPSNYNAQKLRSQLPPMNPFGDSEALAKVNIQRKLPPLEEDNEEIVADHTSQPLPKSINEISSSKLDEDSRAIVITETKNPFRIIAVNTAWENLCGYERDECKGVSLGRLLQGPKTDMEAVTALLSKLLGGEEAGTVLTNYTKEGRRFKNEIRVRPVVDEMGKTINFVGVLRELKDDEEFLGNFVGGEKMQLPFMS